MRLYLARQARGFTGPTSTASGAPSLTPRGIAQAQVLAIAAKKLSPSIIRIFAAPTVESIATAQLIASSVKVPMADATELAEGRSVDASLELIQDLAPASGMLLIGENPLMGELLAVICSGLGARRLILRTGELVGIDLHPAQPVGTGRVVGRWGCPDAYVPSALAQTPMAA